MTALSTEIRAALRAAADPALAPGQQAYMKSAMPFLGVRVPATRRIARLAAKGVKDAALVRASALDLWDAASHREERYAAMALLAMPPLRGNEDIVDVVEHMVRTGQWWDYTDDLAHRVAELHDAKPAPTADLARAWSIDGDLWIRRIAILSQLGRGARLDRRLLADVIEPNAGDREFFIRKAIGWALREYARVDANWVRGFVAARDFSPLTRREALKHIGER